MRRILLLGTLMVATVCWGQTDDISRLQEVKRRLAASSVESDWAKVEQLCLEVALLSSRIYGGRSLEVARAQIALADVQWQIAKFDEALRSFDNARRILEEIADPKSVDLIKAYGGLGYGYHYRKKPEEAKAYYQKALAFADRGFGRTSIESYGPALNLANIYLMERKYVQANEFYIRSYESALTHFKPDSNQVRNVRKARMCADLDGLFSKSQRADFHNVFKKFATSAGDDTEVLNGKALKLPRPKYPSDATGRKPGGRVAVQVLIDENGDVIEAQAVCNYNYQLVAAVQSAREAKFSPTIVSGKPSRVTGIITYNFVP